MNYTEFEILEFIPHNTNDKSSFYAVKLSNKKLTEAEEFFKRFEESEQKKINILVSNILNMTKRGIRDEYFKIKELKIDDNICCLSIEDLRLYCLKYGNVAVILGGGGYKNVRAYQDSAELLGQVELLQNVCRIIDERVKEKEIIITDNSIEGNLIFKKP